MIKQRKKKGETKNNILKYRKHTDGCQRGGGGPMGETVRGIHPPPVVVSTECCVELIHYYIVPLKPVQSLC